jgi:hypothetical protein
MTWTILGRTVSLGGAGREQEDIRRPRTTTAVCCTRTRKVAIYGERNGKRLDLNKESPFLV